jgi:hypothetical protein
MAADHFANLLLDLAKWYPLAKWFDDFSSIFHLRFNLRYAGPHSPAWAFIGSRRIASRFTLSPQVQHLRATVRDGSTPGMFVPRDHIPEIGEK